MKRFTAAIVLSAMLFTAPGFAGDMGDAINSFAQSIAKFYGEMTKHRLVLYFACTAYQVKFGKWPSKKEELLLIKDTFAKEGKDKDILPFIVQNIDITFTPLAAGDSVLIKGRYKEETEKQLEKSGIGKCRFSVIASLEKDAVTFRPSDDTKNDKDFFNLPSRMKLQR